MTKVGGKMLAKGSFGCVYKPALKCKGAKKRKKGFLTKITTLENAQNEVIEQKMFDNLDPKFYYHLKIGDECVPEEPSVSEDNKLKKCILHGDDLSLIYNKNRLQQDYRLIHIEDGGVGLDDYLKKTTVLNNIKRCEMMLYDFTRLIYGLNEMTKEDIGHFDIKTANIVYKEETNRFNYIDFGFSGYYDDFLIKNLDWGIDYWVNPIERAFLDLDDPDMIIDFYNPLLSIAKSNLKLDDILNKVDAGITDKFYELNDVFRDRLRGYRDDFRYDNTVVDIKFYGPYGIDFNYDTSNKMIYDYVLDIRELLRQNISRDYIKIHIQTSILQKLNTFSVSLVMIEILKTMVKQLNYTSDYLIPVSYEDQNKRESFRTSLFNISPIISHFYSLLLKMNVPSFPNRISSKEALEIYIDTIYNPLVAKYNLPEHPFLNKNATPPMDIIVLSDSSDDSILPSIHGITINPKAHTPVVKILNPITGRYISKRGITAKTLKKRGIINGSSTLPSVKQCLSTQVLNPLTNRCISKRGITAKTLKKRGIINGSSTLPSVKQCLSTQVLNPLTNRCIAKRGITAKKLKKRGIINGSSRQNNHQRTKKRKVRIKIKKN